MKNLAWVVRKLEELERKMNAQDAAAAEFTTLVRTRGDGFDQASVAADDRGERQRPVRRLAPWGVAGVPVVGSLAGFVKALGGAFGGMVFGIIAEKYAPQDLEEGETALYNKVADCLVKMAKDGKISVNATKALTLDAGGADDVVINGGTQKVARVDDTSKAGSLMAAWMGQVEVAINALAPGAVAPLSTTFTNAPGIAIINSGADRFKG